MYILVVFQKVWHLVYFWATTQNVYTFHWILHAKKIHCTLHSVFSIWRNCNYRTMLSTQLRRHLNSSEMGFAGLLIGFTLGVLWLLSLAILSVKSYNNANQDMACVSAKQQWNVCNSTNYWLAIVLWVSDGASAMSVWQLVDSWLVRCCCMVFWYFATIQTNRWLIFLQLLVGTTFSQLVISSCSSWLVRC